MYRIEATADTPKVIFDPKQSVLKFEGRCVPENSHEFFNPIKAELQEQLTGNDWRLTVEVKLDYFSTSSSKHILDLFKLLEQKNEHVDASVNIRWYYEDGDDDLKESGEDYAEIVDLPFEFIKI